MKSKQNYPYLGVATGAEVCNYAIESIKAAATGAGGGRSQKTERLGRGGHSIGWHKKNLKIAKLGLVTMRILFKTSACRC